MAVTVQERIQMDAIKNRGEYRINDFGDYVLLTNYSYGVYIYYEDLLLNKKQYPENDEVKELHPWEMQEKIESAKVIREAVTFGKEIANAVINMKKEKVWIWQECIKKFGKKAMYGIVRREKEDIVAVSDIETGEVTGLIWTIEDVEIQKNEVYYI